MLVQLERVLDLSSPGSKVCCRGNRRVCAKASRQHMLASPLRNGALARPHVCRSGRCLHAALGRKQSGGFAESPPSLSAVTSLSRPLEHAAKPDPGAQRSAIKACQSPVVRSREPLRRVGARADIAERERLTFACAPRRSTTTTLFNRTTQPDTPKHTSRRPSTPSLTPPLPRAEQQITPAAAPRRRRSRQRHAALKAMDARQPSSGSSSM